MNDTEIYDLMMRAKRGQRPNCGAVIVVKADDVIFLCEKALAHKESILPVFRRGSSLENFRNELKNQLDETRRPHPKGENR